MNAKKLHVLEVHDDFVGSGYQCLGWRFLLLPSDVDFPKEEPAVGVIGSILKYFGKSSQLIYVSISVVVLRDCCNDGEEGICLVLSWRLDMSTFQLH